MLSRLEINNFLLHYHSVMNYSTYGTNFELPKMKLLLVVALLVLFTEKALSFSARFLHVDSTKSLQKSPVFVAGGSRGVGLAVVRKLTLQGTPVHALVRNRESQQLLSTLPGVSITVGDALDEEVVKSAMEGCSAAITTLGGRSGDLRVDSIGNSNVIEQVSLY